MCVTQGEGKVILLFPLHISPAALYGRQDRNDVRAEIDPGAFSSFDHSWSKSGLDILKGEGFRVCHPHNTYLYVTTVGIDSFIFCNPRDVQGSKYLCPVKSVSHSSCSSENIMNQPFNQIDQKRVWNDLKVSENRPLLCLQCADDSLWSRVVSSHSYDQKSINMPWSAEHVQKRLLTHLS